MFSQMAHDVGSFADANPTIAAILLAVLLSPHFEMLVRFVVKLTPTPLDDTYAGFFFRVLKLFQANREPEDPNAPKPAARRGILRRLFG